MPRPRSKAQARHNASKACDLCRVRKCQCIFDSDTSTQCRRCNRHDVECTFLMGHKPRGPRLHRPTEPSIPPLAKVEMEQLCSVETLHRLVAAFDDFVYPLFPLIHPPTFHGMLDAGVYNTDPIFLRRCMAICAITVASAPNMEAEHCIGVYNTYRGFVNRACDLVAMSRIATQPGWEDNPSYETAVDSVLLSLASHYAGSSPARRPGQDSIR
ncbi:hypothetical protein F5X68DRAFT_262191 [Plectosphaerella plurivora]|uniref:Zn(2)-C6 fungal-type domain-containing protein n=1 Tax=Plectosphaerella plurivora TaxID=936078 RepID=A0A9P8VA57_9PEZI|nr:hypothetical protein F5X68DRAFT_262191 [Plectosphaerella plurivora]